LLNAQFASGITVEEVTQTHAPINCANAWGGYLPRPNGQPGTLTGKGVGIITIIVNPPVRIHLAPDFNRPGVTEKTTRIRAVHDINRSIVLIVYKDFESLWKGVLGILRVDEAERRSGCNVDVESVQIGRD